MKTGTYHMKLFNYATNDYTLYRVRVEIIGESEKSYQVKLLERGPQGQPAGTPFRPRKRNVIIDNQGCAVRLPYKD